MSDELTHSKIFKLYATDVYRYSYFKLSNKEDAQDVTSEVFARLLKLEEFEGETVKHWLIKVAHNVIIDKFRKDFLKKEKLLSNMDIDNYAEQEVDFDKNTIDDELVSKASRYLKELGENTQEVIVLKIWEDLSFMQIADTLEIGESTAKQRFYRGIEHIRNAITRDDKRKKKYAVPVIMSGIWGISRNPIYAMPADFSSQLLESINMKTPFKTIPRGWFFRAVIILGLAVAIPAVMFGINNARSNGNTETPKYIAPSTETPLFNTFTSKNVSGVEGSPFTATYLTTWRVTENESKESYTVEFSKDNYTLRIQQSVPGNLKLACALSKDVRESKGLSIIGLFDTSKLSSTDGKTDYAYATADNLYSMNSESKTVVWDKDTTTNPDNIIFCQWSGTGLVSRNTLAGVVEVIVEAGTNATLEQEALEIIKSISAQ